MNNEKLEQIEQLLQTLIKLIQIKEQNIPLKIIQQRELLKHPKHTKNLGTKRIKKIRTSYRGNSNRLLSTR